MFAKKKKIDSTTSAESVYNSNEMFKKFSTSVFAAHFRSTKAKCGLAASMLDSDVKSKIPELGGPRKDTHKPTTPLKEEKEENENDVEPWFPITFYNAPFSTRVYIEHASKNDYVCVAVPMFSGSRNINFSLLEDGMKNIMEKAKAYIKNEWRGGSVPLEPPMSSQNLNSRTMITNSTA
ncbi:hypothetical protein Bhyg_00485, partial [Pseudolycoriella hygida]